MTQVQVFRHPFCAEPPLTFEVDNVGLWLLEHYGDRPKNPVQLFEGEPSAETCITGDVAAAMRSSAPVYTVVETPGSGLEPWLISMAVSVALNVVATLLFGKKDPLVNRAQESPNNQLSNRQNKVRVLERVEDIYGTVRSIPSLLMPTYNKYINHLKVEYGYYCIGRGYHDVNDVRDGDTLISAITGAGAAIYPPFTSPNSGSPQATIGAAIMDGILTASRSGSVDGITLKPTNQLQITASLPYKWYSAGMADGDMDAQAGDTIFQPEDSRRPNFSAVSEVGQDITISMSNTLQERSGFVSVDSNKYVSPTTGFFRGVVIGSTVAVSGFFINPTNSGNKTVSAVSSNGRELTVSDSLIDEASPSSADFDLRINYSGTRTIAEVGNGYVVLTGTSVFAPIMEPGLAPSAPQMSATLTVDNGFSAWTDWYTLPETDRTQVWTNVVAPSGMYLDDGSKSFTEVEYQLQIEQLTALYVPTGLVEVVNGSVSGASSNERAETLEQTTAWTGPARVRARRTTPFNYDFTGLVNDEIKWIDLYSVAPVTKPHFGNKTTIHTVTLATPRATSVRSRELNLLASRKLPNYNGSSWSGAFNASGLLVSGAIYPTSRIVDILAAVAQDPRIGGRVLADDVDLAQIWSVQQAIETWNPECGQFNYTFDSDAISFEETVNTIANAAFCVAYRQNGKIRLALDRPQSSSATVFTHRNKKPSMPGSPAEVITRKFASDAEYDGVEFVYTDPDTESQETIRLPLSGDYTKLKKFEIPGIRSYPQAWLRANREYYRLKHQRLTIETETTLGARVLLPNSRTDIVDNTRFKSFDGEIVGYDTVSRIATLSRDVEFLPSTPHSIVLVKRNGSTQSIACTEVAGEPNKVLLASGPAEAIVTTPGPNGIRTIFSFAADSKRGAMAWLVQELRPRESYIQIVAVNYSDAYYTADSLAIPDKSGVIYD